MSRMSLSLLALLIFLLSPLGFMTSPVFAAEAPYVDAASADSDEDVYAGESEMDAASADDDEDAQAYADLYAQMMQQQSQSVGDQLKAQAENFMEQFGTLDYDTVDYLSENQVGALKEACEAYKTYLENDTLGDFVEVTDSSIKNVKSGYRAEVTGKFEKTDLKLTVLFKEIMGSPTPTELTFALAGNDNKSLGEKLKTAGFNTLIGLTTVFLILILISFLISLFKYVPALEKAYRGWEKKRETEKRKRLETGKKAEPENKNVAIMAVDHVTTQIEQKEENERIDREELVAVITAAICAATGASSDGFVVRSIKKSKRR